jgi:ferredoxin
MEIKKVNLVSFSPTRTTKKVLQEISKGLGLDSENDLDFTLLQNPEETTVTADELTIFGVPVYGGRVPSEAKRRLQSISTKGAPAVVVVSYGNREFEDALLELKDIVQENGFSILAGGAFIGEHSFSISEKPIAQNRPDATDLSKAAQFGVQIREKVDGLSSLPGLPPLTIPGNNPYKPSKPGSGISPITKQDDCTVCNECATVCPTHAIDSKNPQITDGEACILCCACVKNCPSGARVMENPNIGKIVDFLFETCSARKEPVLFL